MAARTSTPAFTCGTVGDLMALAVRDPVAAAIEARAAVLRVCARCRSYVGAQPSDMDDLASDVEVEVYRGTATWMKREHVAKPLDPFLAKTLHFRELRLAAGSHRRDLDAEVERFPDPRPAGGPDFDPEAPPPPEEPEPVVRVRALLRYLNDHQRAVVEWRSRGATWREVADATHSTPEAVRQTFFRARSRLIRLARVGSIRLGEPDETPPTGFERRPGERRRGPAGADGEEPPGRPYPLGDHG